MKYLIYILLLMPVLVPAQIVERSRDTIQHEYYIVEGDTIHKDAIGLNEVMIFQKLKFKTRKEHLRYLILKRKTIKVYPYAKLAADRLMELNQRLSTMKRKRKKRRYTKIVQRYIEDEFAAELKKLTHTEGQILVKLIHRQTGETTYQLIKNLRSGWNAFWYNNTAGLFKISLKREFNPEHVEEDFLIEDILQREFQSGRLERQEPAVKFDYFNLVEAWNNKKQTDAPTN